METNVKKIAFDDASREQLMDFAVNQLGLTIHKSTNTQTLIAKIKAGYSEEFIVIKDEANEPAPPAAASEPSAPPAPPKALTARTLKAPMVTIQLHQQEGPGGRRPLPFTVNGSTMLVPRGRDSEVPYYIYEAMRNGKQMVVEYEVDDRGDEVEVHKEVNSFPFDVKRLPPDDEVAAWKAAVDKIDAAARKRQQEKEAAQRRSQAA